MCNEYARKVALGQAKEGFSQVRLPLRFPEGAPNLAPLDSIKITDTGTIVRANVHGEAELVQRRWSWPGPNGKPVYNFRSDGREFTSGRCLIIADGFYEFTKHTDPTSKRKHKWLFTKADEPWFCIAGIWRTSDVGEAYTMLTTEPGPDVAPYHGRQIVVLNRTDWAAWLDPGISAKDIIKPLPAGSLEVTQIC
ncbi:MAG: hypothetical protein JWN69_1055 [Alphaproteobacteria bacterium]|nr:hypothetical protein [Alphaproteobacteria bacterium]